MLEKCLHNLLVKGLHHSAPRDMCIQTHLRTQYEYLIRLVEAEAFYLRRGRGYHLNLIDGFMWWGFGVEVVGMGFFKYMFPTQSDYEAIYNIYMEQEGHYCKHITVIPSAVNPSHTPKPTNCMKLTNFCLKKTTATAKHSPITHVGSLTTPNHI